MEDQFDLVIDVGNTRTKIGWVTSGRVIRSTTVDRFDLAAFDRLVPDLPAAVVVGSVGASLDLLVQLLQARMPVLQVTGETSLPIANQYSTPRTLGVDRIANAVGAWKIFPDRPVLVIDAGTCITYDLVEKGNFIGGAISPGKRMRALAMHEHSASLPLVDPIDSPSLIGRSTAEALASGVHHGMINEIHGMIASFRHQRDNMAVMLTGGDGLEIARALKSGIFAHPLLTLEGLHAILVHVREAHGFGSSGTRWSNGPGAAG